jgi:hypothetical protein
LTKVKSAHDWFLANKDSWAWVVDWLHHHPEPPFGMNTGNVTIKTPFNLLVKNAKEERSDGIFPFEIW